MHTHIHTCTYIHTCTHTYTHMHTHVHTHIIPVGIYFTQDCLEFRVAETSLSKSKVISPKRAKAGFEILILQFSIPVFIEMPSKWEDSRMMTR